MPEYPGHRALLKRTIVAVALTLVAFGVVPVLAVTTSLALQPGDTLTATCSTELTATFSANEATLRCAVPPATPSPTPRPTVSATAAPTPSVVATPTVTATPTPRPTPTVAPTPAPTPTSTTGVFISPTDLASRPMSGASWDSIVASAAGATAGGGDVANQDSNHDVATYAAALVAVRTGKAADRDRAIAALTGAIGSESGARWLAVGRNLGAYIIAADLLNVRSGPIYDWLNSFRTKQLADNNTGSPEGIRATAWSSGSNASAQMGFVASALAVYTNDTSLLTFSWDGFRRYCGDRTSSVRESSNDTSWQFIPSDPVGIQDAGATKNGVRLDGAIGNDMSRGGSFKWPPGYTSYPWVGLEGAVPAAVVLDRAGFPAFTLMDRCILRAADYLYFLRVQTGNADWYDADRASYVKHLINWAYDTSYPAETVTGPGRTLGFTEWTHP